jgi:hypothetical protein
MNSLFCHLRGLLFVILSLIFILSLASSAFAVTVPAGAAIKPDGTRLYVPNQVNGHMYIYDTLHYITMVSDINLYGAPMGMVVSPDGKYLYVSVSNPGTGFSFVRIFDISGADPTNYVRTVNLGAGAAKGIAITPDGRTLYVADSNNATEQVHVIDVTNPLSPGGEIATISGLPSTNVYGVAIKPDGSRLYVTHRGNGVNDGTGNLYMYNITNRTSPSYMGGIPSLSWPSYLLVTSDGTRLIVRTSKAASVPYTDYIIYDTTNDSLAQLFNSSVDTNNEDVSGTGNSHAAESLSISPNGLFLYISHYIIPSLPAGPSVRTFARVTANPDLLANQWLVAAGDTAKDFLLTSPDGRIIYLTYSADGSYVMHGSTGVPAGNGAPTAPIITYPLADATNVAGSVTWLPAQDDGGYQLLTYEIETIEAAYIYTNNWVHMSYTAANATSAPLLGLAAGGRYYIRVRAYDGTNVGPWAYSGPFTMAPILPPDPPNWMSHYSLTIEAGGTFAVIVNWASCEGATSYNLRYHQWGASTWMTLTGVPFNDNPTDPNPNHRLTGLSAFSSYEVSVQGVGAGGAGLWFDPAHIFYTIRYPLWIDSFGVGSNEAHLIWENTGANSYTISYGTDANATNEGEIAGLTDPSNYLLAGLLTNTTYYVKVKAVYTGIGESEWSPIATFTTSAGTAPLWISHFNVDATSAHLIWSPMAGAVSYTVSYGTDANATNLGTIPSLTNPNDHLLSGLTANTRYYTKVQAVYAAGTSGWSPIDNFYTLKAPWLSHYNVTTTSAYLTWEVIPAATSYTLRVWPAGGVTSETTETTPPKQLTGLTPNTLYYAKIRANNVGGSSDWSNTDSFWTVNGPQWLSHHDVTASSAHMLWQSVAGVSSYRLEYSLDQTFATGVTTVTASASTNEVGLSGLLSGNRYYVRVRAEYAVGMYSDWATDNFLTTDTPWLSHYGVTNEAGGTFKATMLWNNIPTATSYVLQYWRNGVATVEVYPASPATTADLTGLLANTTYYARIRAITASGSSEWSNTDSFYTLKAPWLAHYNVTSTGAYLTWEVISGAASYTLQVWPAGGTTVESSETTPPRQLTGLLTGVTYYARIRASNIGGSSDWSNTDSFTTGATPALLYLSPNNGNQAETINVSIVGVNTSFAAGVTTANFGAGITVNYITVVDATHAYANIYINPSASGARTATITTGLENISGTFTVNAANTPMLLYVIPSSGDQDQTLNVKIVGSSTSFAGSPAVSFSGTGITVNSTQAISATEIVANISIVAGALVGQRDVTAAGLTLQNGFTVNPLLTPMLLYASPDNGNQGTNGLNVHIFGYGTNFSGSPTVAFTGADITVNYASAVSPTEMVVNVNIAAGAVIGYRTIIVNGNLALVNGFKVNPVSTPTLLYITPDDGNRGDTLTVRVVGQSTNFSGASTLTFSNPGITVNSKNAVSTTELVASITISGVALLGPCNVTVDGLTLVNGFTVNDTTTPELLTIVPSSEYQGNTVTVTVTGKNTNFQAGVTSLSFSGTGITVNSVNVTSPTTFTANISIAGLAPFGLRDVIVATGAQIVSLANGFTVLGSAISLPSTVWMDHYLVTRQPDTTYTVFVNWGAISGAASYDLMYRPQGGTWTTQEGVSITDNPLDPNPNHLLTGLTQFITYEVSVRGVDALNNKGAWFTPPHLIYTIDMPWLAHYGISREAAGTFKVTMIWMDVFGATSYGLQYWPAGGATTEVYPAAPSTTIELTSLTAGVTYYARIKAVRAGGGESGWSNTDSFLTLQGPLWIDSFLVTTTEAHLIWDHPMGGALPYTYTLSYGTDESGTNLGEIPGLTDAQAPDWLLSGLLGGTTYFVKVRAVYPSVGSSEWSPIEMLTTEAAGDLPPSRIIDLRATKVLPAKVDVRLDWSAAMDADTTGVAGYRVFHSTSPSGPWTQLGVDLSAATLTYVHAGALTDLNNHYYYVVGFDTAGLVAQPSNIASVIRLPFSFNPAGANKFWISIPYVNQYTDAASMITDMPPQVIEVERFDPATQSWRVYTRSGGDNFPIVTGEGYEVVINASTELMFIGSHDPTFMFNLTNIGSHLLSIPYSATYTDARSMVDSINLAPQPGTCVSIVRINPSTQAQETLFWAGGLNRWLGTNFTFQPGEGYMILISAPTSWRPTVN